MPDRRQSPSFSDDLPMPDYGPGVTREEARQVKDWMIEFIPEWIDNDNDRADFAELLTVIGNSPETVKKKLLIDIVTGFSLKDYQRKPKSGEQQQAENA